MELAVGELRHAMPQEPEALLGFDRMHRLFQRKMNVEVANENLRLFDERSPLGTRQWSLRVGEGAELRHGANYPKVVTSAQ